MATHSNILAWGIPRTEEPGGLQSLGSQRAYGANCGSSNNSSPSSTPLALEKTLDVALEKYLMNPPSPQLITFLCCHQSLVGISPGLSEASHH